MKKRLFILCVGFCFAVLFLLQNVKSTAQVANSAPQLNAEATELFDVKDSASKEELFDQITKINQYRPQGNITFEFYKARIESIYKISNLLLQKTDLTDDEKGSAITFKISAALGLAQFGDENKIAELESFLADSNNKTLNPGLFYQVKSMSALLKLSKLKRDSNDQTDKAETSKIAQDMLAFFDENEDFAPFLMSPFGYALESFNQEASIEFLRNFEQMMIAKNPEKFKPFIESLQGRKRMQELVGNEMIVEGIQLDGNPIDWNSYKEKVVLIDFWATWCGPCMGEVPNMKVQYEKYHDQGFEIIGYSVDKDLEALKQTVEKEKLPWTIASSTMTEAKNKELAPEKQFVILSNYYAVNSIPRMILIGRDGKVISTQARGTQLNQELEKLFPAK